MASELNGLRFEENNGQIRVVSDGLSLHNVEKVTLGKCSWSKSTDPLKPCCAFSVLKIIVEYDGGRLMEISLFDESSDTEKKDGGVSVLHVAPEVVK